MIYFNLRLPKLELGRPLLFTVQCAQLAWKNEKFSLTEMAIFVAASLIISIAASEVDLEAGD